MIVAPEHLTGTGWAETEPGVVTRAVDPEQFETLSLSGVDVHLFNLGYSSAVDPAADLDAGTDLRVLVGGDDA